MLAMLRRNGVPANLRVGVNRKGEELMAHAWIEAGTLVMRFDQRVKEEFEAFERSLAGAHSILVKGDG